MTQTKDSLTAAREALGLTQQAMADRLGMALRSYQAIEQGESKYRPIHRLAVERVALALAAETANPDLAPDDVRDDAIKVVKVALKAKLESYIAALEAEEATKQ